jgi:hypothetical protein
MVFAMQLYLFGTFDFLVDADLLEQQVPAHL